ncbi:DUF6879 family protein [Streptosporangium subroseum]|uniref:DUF6879 family protein n=1 Tax=Streptosporangium subroseum TaxID=106412 RepID=UPI00343F0B0C
MSSLVTGSDFGRLFTSFDHTAFRLESRERYNPANEREPIRSFLTGETVDMDWMHPWCDLIQSHVAEGRRVERVRIVSVPFSDYTRWGLHLSRINIAAGEDIRYLERKKAEGLGLPDIDAWLFDSNRIAQMKFNESDSTLIHAEIIDDPAIVVQHCHWRDVAMHYAIPRDEFLREYGDA